MEKALLRYPTRYVTEFRIPAELDEIREITIHGERHDAQIESELFLFANHADRDWIECL